MSVADRTRSAGVGGLAAAPRFVRAAIAAAVVLPVLVAMALLAGSGRAHAAVRARAGAAIAAAARTGRATGAAPTSPAAIHARPLPATGRQPSVSGWLPTVDGPRPGHDHGVRIAALLRQVRDNLGVPHPATPAAILAAVAATTVLLLATRGRGRRLRDGLVRRLPGARAPPSLA